MFVHPTQFLEQMLKLTIKWYIAVVLVNTFN